MAQAEGSGIVGPGGLGLRGSGWSGVCDGDQSAHEVGTANPGLALPEKKSSVEQGKGVGGTCFLSFLEIKKNNSFVTVTKVMELINTQETRHLACETKSGSL